MWTSSQARLRRLDADWQQPAPRVHNFPLIARYYAATQAQPAYHRLPDQAWDDLNGEPLFALLDATVSRVGQQCLYQRLRSPLADVMKTFVLRAAQPADAPALTELANQYTYQHLDEQARQNGFLTGSFSVAAVQAMLASVPGQVAYYGSELAGFLINSRLELPQYGPLVQEIMRQLPTLQYQQRALAEYNWFFYGPVLVSQPYRGEGLLRQLFQANLGTLAGRFDLGIAFIATENAHSLRVHTQALGLAVVGEVHVENRNWAILVFPVL